MPAYYNEIDSYAAEWLRNLIRAGLIADGDVDQRSIADVRPDDLKGYTQCHFFAGIGVWSYALRCAGWGDDRPVWTGSCPCQPFSSAGARKGIEDERHLWPAWFNLISECTPGVIFGEQVASRDGLGWLDAVQADMEKAGYASGAADICAAGVGAPHIRQRLYFVAEKWLGDASGTGLEGHAGNDGNEGRERAAGPTATASIHGRVGNANGSRQSARDLKGKSMGHGRATFADGCRDTMGIHGECGKVNGFWSDPDWLFCRDGKWRPVESGTSPLADGIAGRVGRLRAYGNAINAVQAQTFIKEYLEFRKSCQGVGYGFGHDV